MSRFSIRAGRHLVDIVVLAVAFAVATFVRFDGLPPTPMLKRLVFLAPYVGMLQFAILYAVGVPRIAWRYVALRDIGRIFVAVALSAGVVLGVRLLAGELHGEHAVAQYAAVPIGIILIDFALAFGGIAGVRVLWRIRTERVSRARHRLATNAPPAMRTLLVGAGQAGVQVVRELARRPDLGIVPVGFVDDDPQKKGSVIHGMEVFGNANDIADIAKKHQVHDVLITIASAGPGEIRRIVDLCKCAEVNVKIIPGIHEIIDGRVEVNRIRNVSIEDLLGRDSVKLDMELLRPFMANRVVAVTGAGGSIGSELCRQVARLGPAKLLLIEQAEPALFEITRELGQQVSPDRLHAAICDVKDRARVAYLLKTHQPAVIFHAAAHKHVPLMEANPGEAIKNNVLGTRVVAEESDRAGVDTFVLVSTDKAVNPTSVMGATKRVAEVLIQGLSTNSKTRYVGVRFGNVLGSAGSVIPIFRDQIRKGGPITVTHPEMTRYFMTIPEASQLVMQAGAMAEGGEIFVLDMGEPVKIVDLARDLIEFSGLVPEEDIDIVFTGVRPGEKLFEELGFDAEKMEKTRHPKIYTGKLAPVKWDDVLAGLEALEACVAETRRDAVMGALQRLVPEMQADATEMTTTPQPVDVAKPQRGPEVEPAMDVPARETA